MASDRCRSLARIDRADNQGMTAISPAGQAKIDKIRAETELLKGQMKLAEEDPHAKIERLHQQSLQAQHQAIGVSKPLGRVGMGPQAGEAGVGKVAEFMPVMIRC